MGNKRRGRESIVVCDSCGRRVPRDKSVTYNRAVVYDTELRTADNIKVFDRQKQFFCISCGKHRKIFEKKKQRMMRKYNQ